MAEMPCESLFRYGISYVLETANNSLKRFFLIINNFYYGNSDFF